MNKTHDQLIAELKLTRPDVVVDVMWDHDETYVWDGDAPEPDPDDGWLPYNVEVRVATIRQGIMFKASQYLGGCYARNEDYCKEINGYFPQMLEEALNELDREILGV